MQEITLSDPSNFITFSNEVKIITVIVFNFFFFLVCLKFEYFYIQPQGVLKWFEADSASS